MACVIFDFIPNNLVEKDVKILECLLEGYACSAYNLFLALLNYMMDREVWFIFDTLLK